MASMPVQGTPSSFFKAWGQRGSEGEGRPYTLQGVPGCASLRLGPPAGPRGSLSGRGWGCCRAPPFTG